MLETRDLKPNTFDNLKYPPDIFIDSVVLDEVYISVYFHIEDNKLLRDEFPKIWNNNYILDNMFINVYIGEYLHRMSFNAFKKKNKIKNNTIHDSIKIKHNNIQNLVIKAYCSNKQDNIRGKKTTEEVLKFGLVPKAFLEIDDKNYKYINKVVDLRHLNIDEIAINKNVVSSDKEQSRELYVSYSFDWRESSLAYVFDLEKFLDDNSHLYRVFKRYAKFREMILSNSKVVFCDFYKKNISLQYDEYRRIDGNATFFKLSDNLQDTRYLITATDANDAGSRNKFAVKIKILVQDYTYHFVKRTILYNLSKARNLIKNYKELFELYSKNTSIDNVNQFIFEEKYEERVASFKNYINFLCYIFSYYTGQPEQNFYGPFITYMHPLTTNAQILEKLLNTIDKIRNSFQKMIKEADGLGDPSVSALVEHKKIFDYEFKTTNMSGQVNYNNIDYDYLPYYGYDVISFTDKMHNQIANGLKIISIDEFEDRLKREHKKYFPSQANLANTDGIKHLSISYFTLGATKYNFLKDLGKTIQSSTPLLPSRPKIDLNKLLLTVNELNDFKFRDRTFESYFFQLAEKGIYFKNISLKRNNSSNPNETSILFDNNYDSKEDSQKYLDKTGIKSLYFLIDQNKILEIPADRGILHYYAMNAEQRLFSDVFNSKNEYSFTQEITPGWSSVYSVNLSRWKEPLEKPKIIFWYNNIFEIKEIASGTNYSLHSLEETVVNEVFTKKLKLFNKYYIVEKKKPQPIVIDKFDPLPNDAEKELRYNVSTKFLNRITEDEIIDVSIGEL